MIPLLQFNTELDYQGGVVQRLLTRSVILIAAINLYSGYAQLEVPSDLRIREMLRVEDQSGGEQQQLVDLGARLFPAYQRILAAPDVKHTETARILSALAEVKGDRKQFLDPTVTALAVPNNDVQQSAVRLLKQIGTAQESAPLTAILWSSEWTTKYAAAETLVAIGDRRGVDALQIWLNSPPNQQDRKLYDHVMKCRNDLWDRLNRERNTPPAKK